MPRIWLCADDYGMSPGINIAIRDLVVRERLNATSAMVGAASCHQAEAISLAVLNAAEPRVAIGLHVTLTAPFAPVSKDFRPLRDGAFLSLGATIRHAVLRRFDRASLVSEIVGQVEKFSELFGRRPQLHRWAPARAYVAANPRRAFARGETNGPECVGAPMRSRGPSAGPTCRREGIVP